MEKRKWGRGKGGKRRERRGKDGGRKRNGSGPYQVQEEIDALAFSTLWESEEGRPNS